MELERRVNNDKIITFMAKAEEKLETIHTDIISLNTRVGIQNGRIFKLEKWQAFVFGGCAILGIIMTLASTFSIWIKR